MLCTQSFTQKTSLYLYFWTDFNNSHTILTRIVSQFRFSIQIRNLKSADWIASFSKYVLKLWLLFRHFLSDCNDLHVILTRIVSRLQTYFQNKKQTMVAGTATILVESLKCTLWPFQWEGGSCYYNGPQPAALGLIIPSWRHQNRLCSANVAHFARSNRT